MVPVRLPLGVGPLFEQWLEQHFPDRKEKVLAQIRAMRVVSSTSLNSETHAREGILAKQMAKLFAVACRRAGYRTGCRSCPRPRSAAIGAQLELL